MKKLAMIFGGFIALLVAIALIVPLVVDVDKYRPQIVEAANQKINGSLELGKLSLSLWGQIRVEVGGVKLKDVRGKEVLGVQDAYFHIPFLSILSGAPQLTFKMQHPQVMVLKDRAGKLNLMSLMKESPEASKAQAPAQPQPSATTQPTEQKEVKLPGIATRARLGIELRNALVTYRDEATGLTTDVKDLNLIVKDISLSRPMELELWADLDTKLGKTFLLKGPARLTGQAQPTIQNGKFEKVALTAKLDMDSVEMTAPGTFSKKKGMATSVDLAITASEQEARIENLLAKFFNAEVKVQGVVTQLSAHGANASPVVNMNVKSNAIDFKPWVELVPMLKDFELGGTAQLEAEAKGPTSKLGYRAKLAFNNLTAKSPQLKAQPRLDGVVNVVTDQIDHFLVTLKAPANDLKVQGKLVSFTKPKLDVEVTSSGMDLDQLVNFPPPAEKGKAPAGGAGKPAETKTASPQQAKTGAQSDFDAMLDPLRQNKMLGDFVANLAINMKMIKAYNVRISDILCKLSFKDLAAGINQCGLNVFSGAVKADTRIQLKPKMPLYQFDLNVAHLDLAQAVESQMALFKNTVTGKANFSMKGNGASFNPDPAMSQLKAQGTMKIDQAEFATMDVAKMVKEALNKSLGQLGEKIPGIKGKTLPMNLPDKSAKYEFISGDFTLADAKFHAPNLQAKAAPNQGIDLKGSTQVGLKDQSLKASFDVIDTYNLTRARDLSVEQSGVKVEHILADGNAPVHFPISVGCTIQAPCYSYTEVPEALAKVALNNVSRAATGRAKEEVRKQADTFIKKAPPSIQNKLKGLFK